MRISRVLLRSFVVGLLVTLIPLGGPAAEKGTVTVFAAASLREAFDAAGRAFGERTGYGVRFDYGGSDALATQLAAGAPADVFASANDAQMRRVATLVDAPRTLARNRLVVVAAENGPVHAIPDLAKAGVKVDLAAQSVPVGVYGRTALANLDKLPDFGADFDRRVAANVVSEETDVKAVVTKVALGEADAGIVYATDVTPQLAPKLRVFRFPGRVAPEAVYPIAVLKAAPNAAGARAFVEFITSRGGEAFLRARGFEE